MREVQYSSVGGFTQQHVPSGSQRWLDVLMDSDSFQGGDRAAWLAGGNTHIECSLRDLRGWIAPVLAARFSAVQLPPVGAEAAQQLKDPPTQQGQKLLRAWCAGGRGAKCRGGGVGRGGGRGV